MLRPLRAINRIPSKSGVFLYEFAFQVFIHFHFGSLKDSRGHRAKGAHTGFQVFLVSLCGQALSSRRLLRRWLQVPSFAFILNRSLQANSFVTLASAGHSFSRKIRNYNLNDIRSPSQTRLNIIMSPSPKLLWAYSNWNDFILPNYYLVKCFQFIVCNLN